MHYGVAGVLVLLLWIYCIVDCIGTDEVLVRNLPKVTWLFIVIILPTVGSVAWIVLGRPVEAGFQTGHPRAHRPPARGLPPASRDAIGPEDSPGFMSSMDDRRLAAWERELRAREEELRRRERGDPPDPSP
jgi:hypothetical protein